MLLATIQAVVISTHTATLCFMYGAVNKDVLKISCKCSFCCSLCEYLFFLSKEVANCHVVYMSAASTSQASPGI